MLLTRLVVESVVPLTPEKLVAWRVRMLVDGGLERVRRDTFERREAHAHEDTIDQRTDPHLLRGEHRALCRQRDRGWQDQDLRRLRLILPDFIDL